MKTMDIGHVLDQLAVAGVFTGFGLVLFALAFILVSKFAPFDVKKELTEDDNVAVGVMMAGIFVGIAIVIAAAIH